MGTRRRAGEDEWQPGDLLVLDRPAFLALAGWLGEAVEDAWLEAVRERQAEPLRTARELYAEAADGAERLALEMVRQIPPWLLRRALLLLVNSIGPAARESLVDRLNRTPDISEDGLLRRRLAEEEEALAYAVAAAALFDAIDRGLAGPGAEEPAP
jgi:hypothetical protein